MILSVNNESFVIEKINLLNSLRKLLGEDAEIEISVLDKLPVLNSGKRKCVIQEYIK